MLEKSLQAVMGLDPDRGMVYLYTMEKGQKHAIRSFVANCREKPFSAEYFEKLGHVLTQFRQEHPFLALQQVSVVVPDRAVLTDTIHLPALRKKAMEASFAASVHNLYSNSADLKFNRVLALQNKQMVTYAITAIPKDLLQNIHKVCAQHQLSVSDVTHASAAAAGGAMALEPRLRNGSFLLLDMQEDRAKVIFVAKGRTVGFYALPFGTGILSRTKVMSEERLFDHSAAEHLVRNAMAKAQAKTLTMAEEAEPDEGGLSQRRLPDFMLRPAPADEQGFVYENFRIFLKWVLELLAANGGITALGAPEAVYVNMPRDYAFLYDMVNLEAAENGIRFAPLFSGARNDAVANHLALYGGLYLRQMSKLNRFHPSQLETIKRRTAAAKEKGSYAP